VAKPKCFEKIFPIDWGVSGSGRDADIAIVAMFCFTVSIILIGQFVDVGRDSRIAVEQFMVGRVVRSIITDSARVSRHDRIVVMNRYLSLSLPPSEHFSFYVHLISFVILSELYVVSYFYCELTSFDSFLYIDILTLYGHVLTTHYCEL